MRDRPRAVAVALWNGRFSGAHLADAAVARECEFFYWREQNREVDFVAKAGKKVVAVEVKSGRRRDALPGMAAFLRAHPDARSLLVGGDEKPATSWP